MSFYMFLELRDRQPWNAILTTQSSVLYRVPELTGREITFDISPRQMSFLSHPLFNLEQKIWVYLRCLFPSLLCSVLATTLIKQRIKKALFLLIKCKENVFKKMSTILLFVLCFFHLNIQFL